MQYDSDKPRVFISSTIRDFYDLRSALKFWLEEMGTIVQLSEYNDFKREPDRGTFDSCFDAIAQSNVFILLVGKYRGSWYSEPE